MSAGPNQGRGFSTVGKWLLANSSPQQGRRQTLSSCLAIINRPWQGRQLFQVALRMHDRRLYPKNGTQYTRVKAHNKKDQHQNYSPRPMLSTYTPTIRWYMTRSNSETIQQTSPCLDFHNLHVSMSRSFQHGHVSSDSLEAQETSTSHSYES